MPEEHFFIYIFVWLGEKRECKLMRNKVSGNGNNKGWYSRQNVLEHVEQKIWQLKKKKKFFVFCFPPSTTTLLPPTVKNIGLCDWLSLSAQQWGSCFLSCRHWRVERAHETATRVGHVRARHAHRGQYPRQPETELTHKQTRAARQWEREKKNTKPSKQCRSGRDINI